MHRHKASRLTGLVTALAAGVVSLALASTGSATPAAAVASPLPALSHVWVIQLENKSYDESFINNSNTYLWRTLPQLGVLLTQEYGTGHNSLDNYISQLSGQGANADTRADCPDYMNVAGGTTTIVPDTGAGTVAGINAGQDLGVGCVYPAQVKTLADQLTAVGKSWHGWMGDMGNTPAREQTTCGIPATAGTPVNPAAIPPVADDTQSATAADQYAARHNPFVYFHSITDNPASCSANITPLTGLAASLQNEITTPAFNYITPNLCDDAHDATCAGQNIGDPTTSPATARSTQGGLFAADEFLKKYVTMITASPAYKDNGMIIVDFDEGDISEVGSTTTEACCGGTGAPNIAAPGLGGGLTGEVVISPMTKPNSQSTVAYNHYSLLRSLEDGFGITTGGDDGLGHLGYAAAPVGARAASTNTTAATSAFVPYGCDIYSAYSGCNGGAVVTASNAGTAVSPAKKAPATSASAAGKKPTKPRAPVRRTAIKQPSRTLAFTGLSRGVPVLAVLLLGGAFLLRRRSRRTRGGQL